AKEVMRHSTAPAVIPGMNNSNHRRRKEPCQILYRRKDQSTTKTRRRRKESDRVFGCGWVPGVFIGRLDGSGSSLRDGRLPFRWFAYERSRWSARQNGSPATAGPGSWPRL